MKIKTAELNYQKKVELSKQYLKDNLLWGRFDEHARKI